MKRPLKKKINEIKDLRDSQEKYTNGCKYNTGLYNGLELALSIIEEREAQYLAIPAEAEK